MINKLVVLIMFYCSIISRMDKKRHRRSVSVDESSATTKSRKVEHDAPSLVPASQQANNSGMTMTPNQHKNISASQQASNSGMTMTPNQHKNISASQQASNSGMTMTPNQHKNISASQQASSCSSSQVILMIQSFSK